MGSTQPQTRVAIIGAGMAGITLARALTPIADVQLFEKSRGIGGRLSTRYQQTFEWDHGCQFMHAHRPSFRQLLADCHQAGVVAPWPARFVEIVDRQTQSPRQWQDHPPHYVGVPRMNQLAKHLAASLSIQRQTRVTTLTQDGRGWQLFDEQHRLLGQFDWVVSTAPPAQTQALIDTIDVPWPSLNNAPMLGCYALMLGYHHAPALKFDAAVVKGENISWLANNSSKPQRPQTGLSLLAHATNRWAEAHIDEDIDVVQPQLLNTVIELLGDPYARPDWIDCHRWRYANIPSQYSAPYLLDTNKRIAACGDWCIKGRVEAAHDSAMQLSEALMSELT